MTGVLVAGAAPPRRFTAEDLACCGWPPTAWRSAIEHARVYEREHRIAETLQRSLLPERLPRCPGWRPRRATCRPPPRPRSAATGTT